MIDVAIDNVLPAHFNAKIVYHPKVGKFIENAQHSLPVKLPVKRIKDQYPT